MNLQRGSIKRRVVFTSIHTSVCFASVRHRPAFASALSVHFFYSFSFALLSISLRTFRRPTDRHTWNSIVNTIATMPFEFNGAPPALLSEHSAFSTFATATPPANPDSASRSFLSNGTQQPSASPFGAGLSFGQAAEPTFRSSTQWPASLQHSSSAPPFGSAATPTFGSTSTWASSPPTPANALIASSPDPATATTSEPEAQDALSRALIRASRGKSAIFGRNDIAADRILSNIFKSTDEDKREIQQLLTGLREAESSHPVVTNFIRKLLDDYIRVQTMTSDKEDDEPAKSPAASDATEVATVPNNDDEASDDLETAEYEYSIPREHWRVQALSADLNCLLFDEGYIHYPEGARILADYVVDLCFEKGDQEITEEVVALTDREDDNAAVISVVYWTRCRLQKLDNLFVEDPSEYIHSSCANDDNAADIPAHQIESNGTQAPLKSAVFDTFTEKADSSSPASDTADPRLSKPDNKPFRFLDLPAELRNWVYRELMAPGYIGFDQRNYYQHESDRSYMGIRSRTVRTDILRTCRQIQHEAKNILYENTVCTTASTSETILPVISQRLLPDRVLSRLTSLTAVFITVRSPRLKEQFERLHWKQFQEMTSLKKLRICIVEREDQIDETNEKRWMLEQIIERVPKDCQLAFESSEGFEDDFAQRVIDELDAEKVKRPTRDYADAYEVDEERLSSLAEEFKGKQGRKSGSSRDFRFPERGFNLKPLASAGELNPSFVLGGGQ